MVNSESRSGSNEQRVSWCSSHPRVSPQLWCATTIPFIILHSRILIPRVCHVCSFFFRSPYLFFLFNMLFFSWFEHRTTLYDETRGSWNDYYNTLPVPSSVHPQFLLLPVLFSFLYFCFHAVTSRYAFLGENFVPERERFSPTRPIPFTEARDGMGVR